MAAVVGCYLGDRITATAPAAANQPFWFRPDIGPFEGCEGDAAVWTWFGVGDDHFTSQDYPGEYGDAQTEFWLAEKSCEGENFLSELDLGEPGECVEYTGCTNTHRYCLYGPASGHQIPNYFSGQTIAWFRSF
jgi:hypothetical protein